jgi:hypothetical protein
MGSLATRRGIAAALLIALAGCGGHRHVQASSNSPAAPAPGGGLSVSGSVHSSTINTLIVLGLLLGIYQAGEPEPMQSGVPDPSRRVAEQDCTRPLEDASANLRCR